MTWLRMSVVVRIWVAFASCRSPHCQHRPLVVVAERVPRFVFHRVEMLFFPAVSRSAAYTRGVSVTVELPPEVLVRLQVAVDLDHGEVC